MAKFELYMNEDGSNIEAFMNGKNEVVIRIGEAGEADPLEKVLFVFEQHGDFLDFLDKLNEMRTKVEVGF